jgi:Ca2+-transporting ATPase
MAAWLIALIRLGIQDDGGLAAGSAMALTAFAWFRIVCAWQCRSERESALGLASFDNHQLNIVVLVEVVLAFLVTEWDVLNKLLGTQPLSTEQWGLTLVAGASLFAAWEVGKLIARRAIREPSTPAAATSVAAASA